MLKKVISGVLMAACILTMFSGCQQEETKPTRNTVPTTMPTQPAMKKPETMAVLGDMGIAGVQVAEPADLQTSGVSRIKTVSALVGDYNNSYTARTLEGYASELSFTLCGITPNAPAMLDIEEIHLRRDNAIAYKVFINGQEVYGRTYQPMADGPNHAYFDVSAEVVGDRDTMTVRIVNMTEGELRLRRVWAISDPETNAAEQGIDKKMDVVLMLNQLPDNLNYDYIASLVESYRCDNMYNVGLCWEINYLMWGKVKTEEFLNNVILASLQTGAPLYLGINSWWGGTPDGMDGLGGYWQDVQYQQITYDPNNSDGRGHWQLSTPNEWSSTPWLTMNNDYYNATRLVRIKETVTYLQQRTAELALAGQNLPPIHLYTENEPYYWPINWTQYDFNNYPNGVGDFSQWVIEDAAADGITLDPTDGLSEEEAFWLYRNLHTYISEVGSAMADGLGYNYITVKDGAVSYPTEQMVNDAFSHSPIHPIYPNWDSNQRAWENHVLNSIHFGGEWSVFQEAGDSRSLDYLLAYGSFANINAERAGFPGGFDSKDFRVLSQCYAYGLEGVVIYNVLADSDQQNVINASTVGATPMENRNFEANPVFESDFSKKTGYAISNVLTAASGWRWDGSVVIPSNEAGGSLTYRIRNVQQYDTGLRVVTAGTMGDSNGRMEILAGTSPDALQSVGVYENAQLDVMLAPDVYADAEELYIQVRMYGPGMSPAQLSSLSLSKVGIYRGGVRNGCTDGTVYTYDENRVRCQIIAARADVERLMNSYVERAGGSLTTPTQQAAFQAAWELYIQGRYGDAFAAISQSISQLLPATFVVSGHGQLGTYPVEIAATNNAKVTVTLKEVADTGVRFSLSASSDTTVTVSLLTESGSWGLQQQADGDWVIAAGSTAAVDGKATFTVEQNERITKEFPSEFEARVLLSDPNTLTIRSQDTRVTDYCYYGLFPFTADVKVYRAIDGTEKADMPACDVTELVPGDYVQVKLNERGLVTEVYAWYGLVTGTVVAVEEMSLHGTVSNPFVTIQLEDGSTIRLEIGYDCLLSFTGATGTAGEFALVESVGLQVGQKVTVKYCPYTFNDRTRAMEITD